MYHQTGYYLEKEICSGNHKRLLLTQFLHLFHNSFTKTVFTKMIIANTQTNKTNRAIASQAEGHEFEPRLPLYQALGDYPNKDGRLILFYLLNAPSKSNVRFSS